MKTFDMSLLRTGVVTSVGCGVVNLSGFLTAFVGEQFVCKSGKKKSYGQVVNLLRQGQKDLVVGGILIDPSLRISVGSTVKGRKALTSVILGYSAIGALLDPTGGYLLALTEVDAEDAWLVEAAAPSIINRQSINEPLQTGILAIDSMIPIGRGQRELIVGDRQTGKTSIGIDTIFNQRYERVFCVYLPIGQKASSILEVFLTLGDRDCMFYTTVLMASASSSPLQQYLSAYTGCAVAEFFMYLKDLPTFIMYDDLSKHAVSYREIYLLLRRPPGKRGLSWRSSMFIHDY